MPRRKGAPAAGAPGQLSYMEPARTAPCVPAIRQAVAEWREHDYRGASETTRALLAYWFLTDHRLAGRRPFRYYPAQREAIETLIYLYEVASVRRRRDLLTMYAA